MYAVKVDEERKLRWVEVPEPEVGRDQVLIEIHAAALNRADLLQRAGTYPSPPGWPEWMGLEISGVVIECPTQGRWKVGDRVCALLGGGGYAEKVAVPADMALPVPDGLSMAEAAAIPEAFATSYLNICVEGGMKPGEMVLIHAGASGLGMAAIQMVKEFGGRVMTTVSSSEKADFVSKLGADIVVNRKTEDLVESMRNNPVDIAMDCVGGPLLGKCIEHMAVGGRWVVISTLGGATTELDMNKFFRRGIRLIGSTLRSRSSEMKAHILTSLESKLWSSFSSGALRPVVYKTMPVSESEEAHAILQRGENMGKVVLMIRP